MTKMRVLASDSVEMLTTERVALAVLDLAAAVARQRTSEPVEVPIAGPGGKAATALILLGPGIQITLLPSDDDGPALDDESAVAELRRRVEAHEPRPAAPEDEELGTDPGQYFPDIYG